jgi:hypothetical protein
MRFWLTSDRLMMLHGETIRRAIHSQSELSLDITDLSVLTGNRERNIASSLALNNT